MESERIRMIVAAWRKSKMGHLNWTDHARAFFDGARAAALDDDDLVREIDMVIGLIETQGINPLLAMAA